MSLRDVFTGRVYRWNHMKSEATRRAAQGLQVCHRNFLHSYPDHPNTVKMIVEFLWAFHFSFQFIIHKKLDRELQPYQKSIFELSPGDFLSIQAAFNAEAAIFMWMGRGSLDDDRVYLLLDGILDVYWQPIEFQAQWLQCIEDFKSGVPNCNDQLSNIRFSKIRKHLGRPGYEIVDELFWLQFSVEVAGQANAVQADPRWQGVVEQVSATGISGDSD